MLSDSQVLKFQTIYKNRFGKEISRSDALEKGAKLVNLMKIIYTPITKQELLEFQKRREAKTLTKLNTLINLK
ncbi:MAG: hypothetical protein EOM84_00510 [Sphingobacteriia bacterium]|jgi:hypothetical protein|nr:hypothetical protein [Sphingobacteriia bacterium]